MTTMREALEACESWIDRWAQHVGNCEGGDRCTCGRTAILHEARAALSPVREGLETDIAKLLFSFEHGDLDDGRFGPDKLRVWVSTEPVFRNRARTVLATIFSPEWRPDPKTVEVAAEIAAVWRISKLNNGDLTDSQLNDFLNEIGPNIAATIRSLLSHPSAEKE